MMPAVFDVTTAKIAAVSAKDGKTYDFRVSGSVLRFDGFLKVYEVVEEKKDEDDETLQQAAQPGRRKGSGAGEACPRAALHLAASALQRGFAGQGA